MKLDWKDISIIQSVEGLDTRKNIDIYNNGKLPLFVAPMDMVLNEETSLIFGEKMNITLPRGVKQLDDNFFVSYSLSEAKANYEKGELPNKMLIDVANGNMKSLYELSKEIKNNTNVELMVGNIANPLAYEKWSDVGVDWVRCGIGGGSACLTAEQCGVFYPMASLIMECNDIKNKINSKTKIIADGGFRTYSEIIKALACGADSVMLGGIMSKTLESCADNMIEISPNHFTKVTGDIDFKNKPLYKLYRGMSTKEVQRDWGRDEIKTSEGIVKYNKVEYTLESWIDNFEHYLKSAMSYTNSNNLSEFIGKVGIINISENSYNRFHK